MAQRAPTAEEARRPVMKRKDIVRQALDNAMWAEVDRFGSAAEAHEAVRQIRRIHKMWGWADAAK